MVLIFGDTPIDASKTLVEQGLEDGSAVTCVFQPAPESKVSFVCNQCFGTRLPTTLSDSVTDAFIRFLSINSLRFSSRQIVGYPGKQITLR